jgi:hypothetical protein
MGIDEHIRRAGCSGLLTPRGHRINDLAEELVDTLRENGMAYATLKGIERSVCTVSRCGARASQ